jgi:hypothetical protein
MEAFMKRVFAIAALGMFIAGVCTENVSAQLYTCA